MTQPLPLPENPKFCPALFERVLGIYHELGFATSMMVGRIAGIPHRRATRYTKLLHKFSFISDLGLPHVPNDDLLKGHWFGVSERSPKRFLTVATRKLPLRKADGSEFIGSDHDIVTSKDYVIPRHFAWASYTTGWVAYVLAYNFGTSFTLDTEHLIRARMGENRHITEAQRVALKASPRSMEANNTSVPDGRFYVNHTDTVFRIEVECSDKSAVRLIRLRDIYQSQQVPILYLYRHLHVLKATARHIPESALIKHVKIDDLAGLAKALWSFGLSLDFMHDGSTAGKVTPCPTTKPKK